MRCTAGPKPPLLRTPMGGCQVSELTANHNERAILRPSRIVVAVIVVGMVVFLGMATMLLLGVIWHLGPARMAYLEVLFAIWLIAAAVMGIRRPGEREIVDSQGITFLRHPYPWGRPRVQLVPWTAVQAVYTRRIGGEAVPRMIAVRLEKGTIVRRRLQDSGDLRVAMAIVLRHLPGDAVREWTSSSRKRS